MADRTRELNAFLRKGYKVAKHWRLGNMRWVGIQLGYFDTECETVYVGVALGLAGIVLQVNLHFIHPDVKNVA